MISSSTSRTKGTGSDSTAVYNYSFRIKLATDLLVTVRNTTTNVETTLVLTTDYTVQNIGQATGTITLVNASQAWLDVSGDLSASYIIVVRRTRPLQQNTSIRNQGTFYASVHEDEFDDLVMQIQYLWDYINRAVTLPETAQPSDFNPILPAQNGVIGALAGATLQVNSGGNGWTFSSSNAITGLTGDVTASGPGSVTATIANLARSKLASGTANQVVINDGSGNLSSEAQLAISRGGTGAATANAALNALLPAQTGSDTLVLTTDGTNASWVAASAGSSITALTGDVTASGTGSVVATISGLARSKLATDTASRAVVNDSSGNLTVSATTATEIGYVSGVTSAIQTQLGALQPTVTIGALDAQAENANGLALVSNVLSVQSADATHPGAVNNTAQTFSGVKTFSSAPNLSSLTASQVLALDGSKNITTVAFGTNASASALAERDTNVSLLARKFIAGFSTAATAAGTTTLAANSNAIQVFTGTTTQTVQMPVVTTLSTGTQFMIYNRSTGVVTAVSSGLNAIQVMAPGTALILTLTNNVADTTAAPWDVNYSISSGSAFSSGTKNYITLNNFENNATTGWSLGTVGTLTNNIPTGSPTFGSGASGNLSIATVSSGQLAGSFSLSYVSSAATTAGNMLATQAYTIDAEDQAKVLTFKFYYSALSGTANCNFSGTSSNSFGVAIYDVTNSVWLTSTANFGMTQGSGIGICTGTCQTNATTASLRFVVYNANATAGAATLYFDDFSLGPQTAPTGPVVTDWVAFTPTGAWSTNTTYTGFYRRVGGDMEVQAKLALAGAPTSASLTVNIPSGYTIDSTRIVSTTADARVGFGGGKCAGITADFVIGYNSTTAVDVRYLSSVSTGAASAVTQAAPGTFASADEVNLYFKVPIVGWSSNVQMSSDTDTRVISFNGSAGSGQSVTASVTNITLTAINDRAAGWTGSTYVVPVAGDYLVCGVVAVAAGGNTPQVFLNASFYNSGYFTTQTTSTGQQAGGAILVTSCKPGDVISLRCNQTTTVNSANISIFRLSGPSVIAATESVNARYQFINGGTAVPISTTENLSSTYAAYTKIKDTHSAFSTTTGVYTIPVSGSYRASLRVSMTNTAATTGALASQIVQGGSASITSQCVTPFAANGASASAQVTDTFNCLAGDTITLQVFQSNATTLSPVATLAFNSFSIERVGN